jgi:hypothetical protein
MQWLRLVVVGIVVAFMVARVAPDLVRMVLPVGLFGYATNDDGVVIKTPRIVRKDTDPVQLGDRVRIDRIPPFDRKAGLAGLAYTRDNFDRKLPVDRNGKPLILKLKATAESPAQRAIIVIRILVFLIAVGFGAIMVIVKPRIGTVGFFVFCLGGTQPTTLTDQLFDAPWRAIAPFAGDIITGAAPFGLLLFAFSLAVENRRAQIAASVVLGVAGFGFGLVHALDGWRLNYTGAPAMALALDYDRAEFICNVLTALALATAFVRASGAHRQRTGWIVCAFAVGGAGRIASERFYPANLTFWENGVLLSLAIVPVVVVWIAAVKHNFFDVDFVVSRALVYTAIISAALGVVGSSEEILTYVFYNNTEFAYGVTILFSLAIGASFGHIKSFLERVVDRFVFRERRAQRAALERAGTNLLDADDAAMVWTVLLHDIPSILDLSFSGIMMRTDSGAYDLVHHWQWPPECVRALSVEHQLTRDIDRTRGVFSREAVRSTMIKALFPNDRLTYAAPLYFDRAVAAIVFYGHSATGLDIDPEERAALARVMGNASIALSAIELTRCRAELAAATVPVATALQA